MRGFGFRLERATRLALCASVAFVFAGAACSDSDDDDEDTESNPLGGATREADEPTKSETKPRATEPEPSADKPAADDDKDSDEGSEESPAAAGPQPTVIELSKTGHDRLYGVTYDAAGNIYATGQVADGVDAATDFSLVVAKFSPEGKLDKSFGDKGVAIENVSEGGAAREVARGIVLQSTGKIVIAGAAEHDPSAEGLAANDTDIVLVRFNADGTLDPSFGEDGVVRLDLNNGVEGVDGMGVAALVAGDAQWALALASDDRLVVHGTQRAEGMKEDGTTPRDDADWALLRLTADGALDESFGDGGKVTLDVGGAGASARGITILEDGSIVAVGYLASTVLGEDTQQPVLYKVTEDGEFDPDFATEDAWDAPGVWHDFAAPPPLRAEAYGAALQGDHFVTIGYGPPSADSTTTDWVSFRFDASGTRDLTYGTDGATYIDAQGYGDNGRFVLVLPDNRILAGGGGRPKPETEPAMGVQPPADGMVAVLTEDGLPDDSFAEGGFRLYDLGGNDFFWAGALAPDGKHVAIAGIAGGAVMGEDDDNAALLLLPVEK
jgi:uncharacterized delta-60 repeat protein